MLRDLAPAKINLFLHVLGRREDGYHLIESLVGFADFGDELGLEPGLPFSLLIEGPMAEGLVAQDGNAQNSNAQDDNLIARAAHAFAGAFPGAITGRFHLVKNLPIASGIGGGSADAASALRLLARANGIEPADPRVMACARGLGADVPVCLEGQPRLMRGIGHELGPALNAAALPALLVNPGIGIETRAVFGRLGLAPGARLPVTEEGGSVGKDDPVASLAHATRNDLEIPAMAMTSKIERVLAALRREPGCQLARMSGSGATCFALFSSEAEAEAAAESLLAIHYHWWVRPCKILVPR